MPKLSTSIFCCSSCDAQFPKWSGRCESCGAWSTLVEETPRQQAPEPNQNKESYKAAKSRAVSDVLKDGLKPRLATHNEELDRVLGGGIVLGSLILLSGEPGVGKSTLLAGIAYQVASHHNQPVLYISGEESLFQLSERFSRLNASHKQVRCLEAHPTEVLTSTIEAEKPCLVIIDSVQTLKSATDDGLAGSPHVVRHCTALLGECAKRLNIPLLLVGQVTKEGGIAGPKTLEHLVDVVVSLEGDPFQSYRLLRASKNRFGGTSEVGVFEMTSTGMQPVLNPSLKTLEERAEVPGSVLTATLEGSRVFVVEVQALVETTVYPNPVRRASGFDQNRLQLLLAILSKRAGLKLANQDVYVNVVGGLTLKEPASDLVVCAALMSAYSGTAVNSNTLFFGEVGLGGEVRSVQACEQRVREAARFGIRCVVLPAKHPPVNQKTTTMVPIATLEALKQRFSKA